MSINDAQTLSTDVIYFDISKAFDSVNHDLILHKLKCEYAIDGSLLKFLMNYLGERERSVVLDGILYARYLCSRDALGLKAEQRYAKRVLGGRFVRACPI